jgi:hypothetical protein
MLLGIDHLVIVVNDLESVAQDYRQLGFTVVPGGRHPVGSHNVLIPFADGAYLEIIAFYRQATDHRWWDPLETGERLVDYCLQTDDLRGDTEKFRGSGIEINDPVPWARTRPDGYELKWLLSLARGRHRGVAPFLIEDVTPRDERVPQTLEHRNGASGVSKLTIAVRDTGPSGRSYQYVLGRAGESTKDSTLSAAGLRFPVGPHMLEFLSPTADDSPLADWLEKYGDSPYSAEIETSSSATGELDLSLTHGGKLYLTHTTAA